MMTRGGRVRSRVLRVGAARRSGGPPRPVERAALAISGAHPPAPNGIVRAALPGFVRGRAASCTGVTGHVRVRSQGPPYSDDDLEDAVEAAEGWLDVRREGDADALVEVR